MNQLKTLYRSAIGALAICASTVTIAQLPAIPGAASLSIIGGGDLIDLPIAKVSGGLPGLVAMGASIAQNPTALTRPVEFLAIPAGFTIVPVLEVLASNPLSVGDYFLNGGTIIFSDISIIPRVPVLNQGL